MTLATRTQRTAQALGSALPAPGPTLTQPYPLTPAFAFFVALRLARSALVWGRIGEYVQPACLGAPVSVLLATAAADVARTLGRAPASDLLVYQRLRTYVDNGTHTMEEVVAVLESVEEYDQLAQDAAARGNSPPDDEAVIRELLPILRQRAQRQAFVEGGQLLAAGNLEALEGIAERIVAANRLGAAAESDDDDGWDTARATIVAVQGLPRCPVGVDELDVVLGGGPHLGSYTTWAAATGGAKSTAICHVIATALMQGQNALLALLELPRWEGWAKVIANLTGIPLDAIREDADGGWITLDRMKGRLGDLRIKTFPEGQTTTADIARWRQRAQQKYGLRYAVVGVDGVDHLTSTAHDPRAGGYDLGRHVCAELDQFALGGPSQDDPIWLHVTSHIQRGKKFTVTAADGTLLPGKDDLADSKHRANKTHILVTNVVRRDPATGAESIYFNLGKSRFTRSDIILGPLPCDMATARLVLPLIPPDRGQLPGVGR